MALEQFTFDCRLDSPAGPAGWQALHVGYVCSGDLEILAERDSPATETVRVQVTTSIGGYESIWRAVVGDFIKRRHFGGCTLWMNDNGATPAVVKLRLEQLYRESLAASAQDGGKPEG